MLRSLVFWILQRKRPRNTAKFIYVGSRNLSFVNPHTNTHTLTTDRDSGGTPSMRNSPKKIRCGLYCVPEIQEKFSEYMVCVSGFCQAKQDKRRHRRFCFCFVLLVFLVIRPVNYRHVW